MFRKKYDDLQDQLRVLAARYDLLTGNKMEYLYIKHVHARIGVYHRHWQMFAMPRPCHTFKWYVIVMIAASGLWSGLWSIHEWPSSDRARGRSPSGLSKLKPPINHKHSYHISGLYDDIC